jgi:hypothetical protein
MGEPERVEAPHWGWWVAILAGMGATGALAISDVCFAWFAANVTREVPQWAIGGVFAWACWLHVKKGLRAVQLAERAGMRATSLAWGWQTFLLGFASLRLLERRIAAQSQESPRA